MLIAPGAGFQFQYRIATENVSESTKPKQRVLVVDDEPAVCHSVRLLLTYSGYEVKTALSPEEALNLMQREQIDLVVTDYNMPAMMGDVFASEIKRRWPSTPIIMLTASAVNLRLGAVPLQGVDALLEKPFEIGQLLGTIAHLLNPPEDPSAPTISPRKKP